MSPERNLKTAATNKRRALRCLGLQAILDTWHMAGVHGYDSEYVRSLEVRLRVLKAKVAVGL